MTSRPLVKQHYVEYLEGSLPLIISAPHGGSKNPKSIKTRTSGVFEVDSYTKELTQLIVQEFFEQTHAHPHTIIMNLSRSKVDANRVFKEAVSQDIQSQKAYHSFHDFIAYGKDKVATKFGKGLYIDIHGQSHAHGCIEFGYLIHNDTLKLPNEILENHQAVSSIKSMKTFSNYTFVEQIKGEVSLSGLMDKKGFKSIPSKQMPYEKNGNYFEGAYNTHTYSSLDGHCVSAVQVEFPFKNCRDTKANRIKTAKAFVHSLLEYMKLHFDLDLRK